MFSAVILFSDAKREYFLTEQQYIAEVEVEGRARIIEKYLQKFGFSVFVLPGDSDFIEVVKRIKPLIVFNLADSLRGEEYLASTIAAGLEIINVPYTGTGELGLALSTNKFLTNTLLEHAGIKVPKYQLFSTYKEPIHPDISYPVISKLNSIHGSIEINASAISENEKELRARLKFLINTYHDEVLVSEYIEGREIAAVLLEGVKKKVYTGEKILDGEWATTKYNILTFDAVWTGAVTGFHYKKFQPTEKLKELVKKAYTVLRMDDYAKFDIRMTSSGEFYFIDANPNCALGPIESECDIGTILSLYGVDFDEILRRLILNNLNGSTPAFLKSGKTSTRREQLGVL